jgi:hypothetical protein
MEPEMDLDQNLRAHLNKYIDQRIVEASRQVYDALSKKIRLFESPEATGWSALCRLLRREHMPSGRSMIS